MDVLSDVRTFFDQAPGGIYTPGKGAVNTQGHAVLIVGELLS